MIYFIAFLLISLVVFKYTIDTQMTIKDLVKDRNQFRSHAWRLLQDNNLKKKNPISEDTPYQQLKEKISLLKKDLNDTDFSTFDNIKEEILSALEEIDSYGETNDKSKD